MSQYLKLFAGEGDQFKLLSALGDPDFAERLAQAIGSFVDVRITAAEMDALNASPKTLIAAPGAGKVIQVERVLARVVPGSTAFELGTGTVDLRYQNSSGGLAAQLTNAFVESAAAANFAAVGRDAVALANQPLVAHASADVTAGDGNLYLRIYYRVVDTALIP